MSAIRAYISRRTLAQAKYRAKKKRIPFDLDPSFVFAMYERQKCRCAYSGRLLQFTSGHPDVMSLDRVDNSVGYLKTNVVLVSAQVNAAKSALSVPDFVRMAKQVAEHTGVTNGM